MLTTILLALAVATPPLQQRTDTTFNVPSSGTLDLENNSGDILIRTWDRNAIRIVAEHAANMRLDIAAVGSVVSVEAEARGGRGRTNISVHYEIWVPIRFNARIEGINSNVVLENIGGAVEVETVNGNIILRGGTGRVNLESVSGEILVDGARGTMDVSTVNHGVRITRSSGDVRAETVNGSIQMSEMESSRVEATSVNGRIQYQGTIREGGRYLLNSHNGSLGMTIPTETNATISVRTHSGSVETDFPVEVRQLDSRRRLSFTIGNGGARIELESFGGSISLRRPAERR